MVHQTQMRVIYCFYQLFIDKGRVAPLGRSASLRCGSALPGNEHPPHRVGYCRVYTRKWRHERCSDTDWSARHGTGEWPVLSGLISRSSQPLQVVTVPVGLCVA